jgi:ferrochelatase
MITKKGILLMNLGSPDSTQVKDLRKYLDEFLMDERVIDKPWLLRALLVKGIIIPFRAPKSAEAYKAIWTENGSPLIETTRHPHYAMSSYETAVEYAKEIHRKKKYSFRLSFVKPFYNDPDYLYALSENIKPFLNQPYDQILFSYHGIPERHIRKSDITGCHCLQTENCCEVVSTAHIHCYRHQVFATTKSVAEILNVPKDKYSLSFQSRLGKGWITPFTDIRLRELPGEGIKKLLILCPAFVSDCLETLEEIEIRGREIFMDAGGESFTMIPCLNVNPLWVKTVAGYVTEN